MRGVHVSLDDIYRQLVELREDVRAVKQTVNETLKPQLDETRMRVATLELRVYAIIAGLVTAFGAGKGLGLL